MYPGVNNSPQTTLTTAITADATTIPVADASVLPTGPNLATIGTESNAEVIRYASKSGNSLTGCERGFGGTTASVWPLDTPVYRAWTKYDYDTLIANINAVGNAVPDFSGLEGMVKVDEDGQLTDAVAGTDYQAPLTANVDYVTPDTFDAHADNTTIHVTAEDKEKWNNPPQAPVQSVFGRTGAVVAQTGDYTPEQVGAAPATHASQHASTGDDPVTPASIGAASATHAATHNQGGSDPISLLGIGAAVNPNLLINADFRDPANPTGQTSWEAAGYTYMDALLPWGLGQTGLPSMTLHDGYATFAGKASYIGQKVPSLEVGETYTASCLLQDGTFVSGSAQHPSSDSVVIASGTDTNGAPISFRLSNGGAWVNGFVVYNAMSNDAATSVNIVAIKLERGSKQTLAYQDGDTWKLYEAPNRAKQMSLLPMFGTRSANYDRALLSYPRKTEVGQYDNVEENLAKPWFKFAHVDFSNASLDTYIAFRVMNGYNRNHDSTEQGILLAHIKTNPTAGIDTIQFVWEYANSGIDPSEFVMCYQDKTDTSPVHAELWCKRAEPWNRMCFEVISELETFGFCQDWILDGGFVTKGGEASLPSDMTQLVSTINKLKGVNPDVSSITLTSAGWTGEASPYTQAVTLAGVTANTKVDLQPDAATISQLITGTVAGMYIANDGGTLTAYAVNAKPTTDLTIQVTLTETTGG